MFGWATRFGHLLLGKDPTLCKFHRWFQPIPSQTPVKKLHCGVKSPRLSWETSTSTCLKAPRENWRLIVALPYTPWRIQVCYIWYHGSHQYTPVMLAYIPAPWIRHGTHHQLVNSPQQPLQVVALRCGTRPAALGVKAMAAMAAMAGVARRWLQAAETWLNLLGSSWKFLMNFS